MSQIRMAEYFIINYLDLQSRFHYAPNDSSSHVAEKVMRSLNECLRDGRSIPVPCTLITEDQMAEISNDEIQRLKNETETKNAKKCAEEVKHRFNSKRCMGTTIHAFNPWYEDYKKFFFDEQYMIKCASANSSALLEKCAGKAYYKFVRTFFDSHYFIYDNGFEGIRSGCHTPDGSMCLFHSSFENLGALSNGWSGVQVFRIQPPVPEYSSEEAFHYALPEDTSSGNI